MPAMIEGTVRGVETGVAFGAAFCGLEEAVDGFKEAAGLAGLGQVDDAVEVLSDRPGDVHHGLDMRAHMTLELVHHCLSTPKTT